MNTIKAPAPSPCGSCPYRRDVPSGVWTADEYEKLPPYDRPTGEQPPAVFMCHQADGRPCAGWVGCHDMDNNLGLRFAAMSGNVTPAVADLIRDYTTPTPLFASGAEAAEHGLADVDDPGVAAQRLVGKLEKKLAR